MRIIEVQMWDDVEGYELLMCPVTNMMEEGGFALDHWVINTS